MKLIPVTSEEQINGMLELLKQSDVIAYDYETFETKNTYMENLEEGAKKPSRFPPIDMFHSEVAGVSYGLNDIAWYIPINHKDSPNFSKYIISKINKEIKNKIIVCHNAKFELMISRVNNIYLNDDNVVDTMLLAKEIVTELNNYGLKYLAKKYVGITYEEADLAKKYKMNELTLWQTYKYACTDTIATYRLYKRFMNLLDEDGKQHFEEIESPLLPAVVEMEMNGFRLDLEKIEHYKEKIGSYLKNLESEIYKEAYKLVTPKSKQKPNGKYEFNINSGKQLGQVLYGNTGYPIFETTPKGAPSCNSKALVALDSWGAPIANLILKYRKFDKMLTFFLNKLPYYINGKTGRIHPSYSVSGAETGRFTSYSPNMQQIKKVPEELGDEKISIRSIFLPIKDDEVIMSLDFSGIELRVCAIMTGDKTMLDAFKHDKDLHAITTQNIFGKDIIKHENFKKIYRQAGKKLNFGILYGGSAQLFYKELHGLFKDMKGYSEELVQSWIDTWYETFSGVNQLKEEVKNEIFTKGYAKTLFGKKRTFFRYAGEQLSRGEESSLLRKGFNHLIQGTAADMMKIVLIEIYSAMRRGELPGCKMVATIHDEVVFSVKKPAVHQSACKLHEIFTDWNFEIPIYSSISVGENFGEMEDFEKDNGDGDLESLKEFCEKKGWYV